MCEKKDMKLSELNLEERKHWELHLKAALKDTPSLRKQIQVFLKGGTLPNLKHPAYIHDWLEKADRRVEMEAYDG